MLSPMTESDVFRSVEWAPQKDIANPHPYFSFHCSNVSLFLVLLLLLQGQKYDFSPLWSSSS